MKLRFWYNQVILTFSSLKDMYPIVAKTQSNNIYDASSAFLNESASEVNTQMSS